MVETRHRSQTGGGQNNGQNSGSQQNDQGGQPDLIQLMQAFVAAAAANAYQWSLAKYRAGIDAAKDSDKNAEEAWDELEKSIVANIADDVRVGVKGDAVELVIEKRLDTYIM